MSVLNQRHQLVLLFTDLTDSTRIAAQLEPEHYAELLSQLRQHTTTIIARHGGEVVRVDGDGALCIFGYPLAHEDAGRRATEAALDLHTAVTELAGETAVSLHSGIHAGVVLLRSGDLVRGRYEMLGDATNVAARLCDAAGPGGILVSEETLGGDRHLFRTGPQRMIALSGHDEPLRALPIVSREDVPHRFAAREIRGLSPFVGRQSERQELLDWLDVAEPPSPVMLVHGPAGIGKSRLLRVLVGDVGDRGWTVASGYCEGYLGASPLQPLLQIAASLDLQFVADSDPVTRIETIVRAANAHPLLLVIDDWQWADDASRSFVARLARDCVPNLRLLLTSRESNPGLDMDSSVRMIKLGPLDSFAARASINNLLAVKDPFAVARIEAATGGSPLLIEELCHAYAGSGPSVAESRLRGAWFDLSVQSRFASLAPDDAQLLRLAAVIGSVAAPWLLASVRGAAIDGGMLDRLQDADFLFPGESSDTLRFKHGLTRDAVYAAIGLKQRTTLHARVLEVLELRSKVIGETALLDALAYHSLAAGAVEAALPYSIKAGDAALATGALDRAQGHYKVAFDLIEGPGKTQLVEQLRHVIKMFGRSCVSDPGREHVPLLERMLTFAEATGDSESIALATYWIGAHFYGLGEPLRSLAQLERAYGLVKDSGAVSFIAQVEANLGQSSAIACRYDQAIEFMDRSIAKKRKVWRPDRPSSSLAYCLSARALILADMGRFDESARGFDDALLTGAGTELRTFPSIETQRALAAAFRGNFEVAIERAIPAEEAARTSRSRTLVYAARAIASNARWKLFGEKRDLDILVEVALSLLVNDQQQRLSFMFGWIAEAMAGLGEEAATRLFAKQAFKATFKGDRLGEASAARALASLAARSAAHKEFRHYLTMADRAAAHRNSIREAALNRVCEANCLHWSGDRAAAIASAEDAALACSALGLQNWRFAFG